MTDPKHTEPVVTQAMMARAADLAEKFYLADFGGNDVAALRQGIMGDSAIRDFVLQVEAIRTAAEAAAWEKVGFWKERAEQLERDKAAFDAEHLPKYQAALAAEAASLAREDVLVSLLTKAVGDIAAALELAGSAGLIRNWTADYVAAINAHDARAALSPAAKGGDHG